MNVKDLMDKLKTMPPDAAIGILDWRKNLNADSGDGSSSGIYCDISVTHHEQNDIPEDVDPWVSLAFENEDFNNEGHFINEY